MDRVERLHHELDFAKYSQQLRGIGGFWNQLMALQVRAKRDAKALTQYKQLLERGIAQVSASEGLSDEDFARELDSYWKYYDAKRREFGVAALEAERFPRYLESWTEKQLPKTWTIYMAALTSLCETGSQKAFDDLRHATVRMIKNFVSREDK